MSQTLFTPAAVLDLLTQIDELKEKMISVSETLDGNLQIEIGESTYLVEPTDLQTTLELDEEDIEEVEDLSEIAYQELSESGEVALEPVEPVESGIIKEFAKTLLIGGLVRLAGKKISNMFNK